MKQTAYIALGSNLGDREGTLRKAVLLMGSLEGIEVVRLSHFIETEPMGGPESQGPYLNGVAELQTDLSPEELLAGLNRIEEALGRDRPNEERWGPRTCDLDIVLMGEVVLGRAELTIPHPRMHERLFVLLPLAEIAPEAMHPGLKKTVRQLLAELQDAG